MQNLKVTCNLLNGIVTNDGYLPLDGILAAYAMREQYPDIFYQNSVVDQVVYPDMPIQKIDNGNGWYYACSFVEAYWRDGEMQHWHKRNTIYEQTRYVGKGSIDLGKGKTKAYRTPIFTLFADTLTWYLVADKFWVETALSHTMSIGKKRNTGHGTVVNWQVKEVGENLSVFKQGNLMRSVPEADMRANMPLNMRLTFYGLRPPYWHKDNIQRVALPAPKVVVK